MLHIAFIALGHHCNCEALLDITGYMYAVSRVVSSMQYLLTLPSSLYNLYSLCSEAMKMKSGSKGPVLQQSDIMFLSMALEECLLPAILVCRPV